MDLKKLVDLLIKHEGVRNRPYLDTTGNLTIGVGHNLTAKGLTKPQIMSILMDDVADTINFLNLKFPWLINLDDVQQRALADLTFDLMGGVMDFKKMLAALEAKDWDAAAKELLDSKFAKQAPGRAKDLAIMILTGQDLTNG